MNSLMTEQSDNKLLRKVYFNLVVIFIINRDRIRSNLLFLLDP